jgi:hypothetical protein
MPVLWSRSHKEPHQFGGAGAVTPCGFGSDGFKLNVLHKRIIINVTNGNSFLLFPFIFVIISIIQKSEEKVAPTLMLTFFLLFLV